MKQVYIGANRLICGKCEDILPTLVKEKVKIDAVITDLPYGTTKCVWDSVIDFKFMWGILHSFGENIPIVLFGKEPFTSALIMSNPMEFRERVDWLKNKSGNGFSVDQRHVQVLEDIIIFSSKLPYTFNPQKWLVADKEFLTQRKTFAETELGNNVYGKMRRVRKPDTGERNPINIVSCAVPFTPSYHKTYADTVDLRYHPTQKPLDLLMYLVNTYTNKGDMVLDFTMGSGTTGVACVKLDRNFIGIEQEESFWNIAVTRVQKVDSHI